MRSAIGVLLAMMWIIPGCAGGPTAMDDTFEGAPPDFSLDLAVLRTIRDDQSGQELVQSNRYALLADGLLCHGSERGLASRSTGLPPVVRALSRNQIVAVWSLARQLGFTDPQPADQPVNFKLVPPPDDEVVYLADFNGSGRRWSFVRRIALDQPSDPAMDQLVRRLAQLVWVDELADAPVKVMPKRYDFGPDPYARYRKP